MKSLLKMTSAAIVLLASVGTAFAAGAPRTDNSGIVVWVFLGICALIIIAQLVPAMLMLFGFVKAIAGKKEEQPQRVTR